MTSGSKDNDEAEGRPLDTRTQPLARDAMAYVLAGGRGSRLKELTDKRAKPAVYFGGKTRIIDFALSNALNSGVRRMAVATQYKAHSLIRHLQRGWNFLRPERNESFDILPASQRVSEHNWYLGTADAVFQNIDIIEDLGPRHIVLLAGDHIYKMDYEVMLQQHVDRKAGVTVCCMKVPRADASGFGVVAVDESDRRMLAAMAQPRRLDQIWPLARTPRFRLLAFLHFLRTVGALSLVGVAADDSAPHRVPRWTSPAVDETFTIVPRPRSIMCGATARQHHSVGHSERLISASISSGGYRSKGLAQIVPPTPWMATSTRPNCSIAASTTARAPSSP